ncbi:MAG: tRNA lysidine(34) synthetase TilS [Sulfurimonadaceae bacterium]|nr:tRNA lysidine(34) synthetase TilS [Sulfurimonadaceae bacterium]
MLSAEAASQLQGRKNLLAFSAGGDSTALFFLLLDAGIDFDIALVNYHTRPQSDDEAAYARVLGEQYGKLSHIADIEIDASNFEHEARKARYNYFEALIEEYGYDNLITAHQLDDRLEWMMMQLCKGAGVVEMSGMKAIEDAAGYTLVRPLLQTTKQELLDYLKQHRHTWFEDESNRDENFKRNFFRHNVTGPLLERYSEGIKKSFTYIDEDRKRFETAVEVQRIDELLYFATPASRSDAVRIIDKSLKQSGFMMRQGDRERLKDEESVVVGRRYVVAIGEAYTFIAPYEEQVLDKAFKEQCRKLQIDPKLRPYLARSEAAFKKAALLLGGDAVDLHGE